MTTALADAIIDGDTLDLDGQRVRLHGIDAFEQDQPCWTADGREWACGGAATRALEALVAGELVECRKIDEDRYGGVVARCTLEDGSDLGAELVAARAGAGLPALLRWRVCRRGRARTEGRRRSVAGRVHGAMGLAAAVG